MKRLNVAQAAEISGKHQQTVRRALEAGELHGTQRKYKGRWLIHPDCLDAWCWHKPCEHQQAEAA